VAVWSYRYGGVLRIKKMKKKEENNKIQTRRAEEIRQARVRVDGKAR
jgi:hypothetical protein